LPLRTEAGTEYYIEIGPDISDKIVFGGLGYLLLSTAPKIPNKVCGGSFCVARIEESAAKMMVQTMRVQGPESDCDCIAVSGR
jgi:hypothetical protein